ncbi:MAG: outer membrane protein transport protein [Spirochaetota bacterium]
MNKKILFLSIVSILYSNQLYAGNYGDVYGAHARANGMGNAVSAIVNDSSAVFYNVAGLGRVSEGELIRAILLSEMNKTKPITNEEGEGGETEGSTAVPSSESEPGIVDNLKDDFGNFHTGIFDHKSLMHPDNYLTEMTIMANYANPVLTTNAPSNQDLSRTSDHYGALGLSINLSSVYDLKRNIRIGLNIHLPASGNLMVVNDLNPTVHRHLQHGITNQKPTIMGGLGIEVIKDMLYLGAGFNVLAKGTGAILLKDVPISPDTVTPNQQAIIELKPLATPNYGMQFRYGKLNFGVAYRREIAMSVDALNARAQTTLLSIQLDMDVALLQYYSPRIWTYGFAYNASDRLTLSFDLNRELWSGYKLSRTKKTYSEDIYLNDTANYRAGLEYKLFKSVRVRAGYTKRPTPIRHNPTTINWIDFDKLIATGGFTYILFPSADGILSKLQNPVTFDFVLEYQKMHGRFIRKYIPTNTNPDYSSGGRAWHAGVSISLFY